jgi:hypothetical protein
VQYGKDDSDDDETDYRRDGAQLAAPDPGEIVPGVGTQPGQSLDRLPTLRLVLGDDLVGLCAHTVAPDDSAGDSPRSPERPAVISSTT